MSFNLPREIIKWIQGLDLSYSVIDYKRDLNDGFLVAEIFSRYYPEKMTQDDIDKKRYIPLSMHMFDHSQKLERRKNNWHLLELFFNRNNQLGNEMPFTKKDINQIPDNNYEQLRNFLCKLYTFLTTKKITKPPLASLIQTEKAFATTTGQTQLMEGHGASYILTEKGLEKLDKDKKDAENQNAIQLNLIFVFVTIKLQKSRINETSQSKDTYPVAQSFQSKKTAFLRNYSKPIGQAQEASAFQIDVKNIAVRPVQMPVAKLKEKKDFLGTGPQKQNMSDSFRKSGQLDFHQTGQYQQSMNDTQKKKDKKMSDKTIYDILNEMITDKFKISNFQSELTKVKVMNNTLIQAYIDNIETFTDEFSMAFFNEILDSLTHILSFLSKDPNEHWKFMNFLFLCLKGLGPDKECFRLLIKIINQFGQLSLEYNAIVGQRTKIYFKESILPVLSLQIKNSLIFERKEMLIQILYNYCGKDSQSKHEMISQYKDQLNNMNLFMQSLVVLFKYETMMTEENKIIIDDMLHYAKINLFSPSTDLRTTALALFCQLADLNYELLENYFSDKVMDLAKYDWWETKCLVIMLFSKIVKGIINSAIYQSLVKQSSTIHKQYSTENEEKIAQLKKKMERFAAGIRIAAFPPASELVLRTTFIYIIDLIGEQKDLLELFTNLLIMCSPEMRKWVLQSEPPQPNEILAEKYLILSDKSLKYQITINSQNIQQYSHQILEYIVQQINEYKDEKIDSLTQEYMDIILFAFTFTDFKLVNMEQCEHIANTLKEYIFLALCEEDMCQQAKVVMEKLMKLKFFSEVNIPDSERLLCSAICLIYQNKSEYCMQVIEQILLTMVSDAENGIDVIKRFLIDVYKGLSDRLNDQQKNANINFEQLMDSTNLREIFLPIEKMIQLQIDTQMAAKKARESAMQSSKASAQGDKSQDDIQNQSQQISQKSYSSSKSKKK